MKLYYKIKENLREITTYIIIFAFLFYVIGSIVILIATDLGFM